MDQYINKADAVAEIEKLRKNAWESFQKGNSTEEQYYIRCGVIQDILASLDTLEVKEIKLPSPRFPHLNNIVDKVFGTGNLESLEYEEAEQLVLLAKEELLKDLEVDLEKEIDSQWKDCTPVDEGMGCEFANISIEQFVNIAKHFFELGLKAQKGDIE